MQDCTKTDRVIISVFSSRILQTSNSFHLKASFKFSLTFFQAGNNVPVYLLQCRLFRFSTLFSNARSKVQFILCPKIQNSFQMRLNSWMILQLFVVFFLQRWAYEFAPAPGSLASVSDHVTTSQNYTSVEHVSILTS